MNSVRIMESNRWDILLPMRMTEYLKLRREETKIRLRSQIQEGYRNGLNQDEIIQITTEAHQEALEDMKFANP